MAKAQRDKDANSGGGIIDSVPQSTVFVNGELLSINGSKGTGHGNGLHVKDAWETANGFSKVTVGGTPVNHTGNVDTCGHPRVGGSSNVNINTSG